MRPKRRSFATAPVRLVVIVVGVSEQFLERFRVAAAPRKAEILSCDEATFAALAAARIPRTVVVRADAYERAAAQFDSVVDELCARLVKVATEDIEEAEVEALVHDAVRWA